MSPCVLEMVRELQDSGFTDSQAEGIVGTVMEAVTNSDWVTKDFLRAELTEVKAELKTELVGKIEGLKSELKTESAQLEGRLEAKIESVKTDMIKWIIGLQVGTWGLIFTLFGFAIGLMRFSSKL